MCRPYGFGNHADMTETFSGQLPTAGSGYPCWLPHASRCCHRMNHDVEDSIKPCMQFPLSIGTLLARDSIVGIPIPCSISLPASLFTRTAMHDPVTNALVTLSSLWWCITEWAQRYLSVIRSDKSQSRSVSTQQLLSEIPVMHLYSHPVTLWRLIHPRHSYGIRELHDLMV